VIIVATTCVGRDRELAELDRRYAATATRGADVVAVVGESGIGKSALLRLLTDAHAGARWARAAAWEADTPGAVLSQQLQERVPAESVAAASHFVERITGPETARSE